MKTLLNRAQCLQISFSKAKMHFYTETYGSNDKNFGMISMQRSSLEDCFKHLCLQIYPIVKFQVFLSTSNIAFMSATGAIRRESEAAGEHGQGDQSCSWVHCCGLQREDDPVLPVCSHYIASCSGWHMENCNVIDTYCRTNVCRCQ